MRRLLLLAMPIACVLGCSLNQTYTGDFFYLKTGGEYLPIWVRGNTASGVFVVFLSGGPGASAMNPYSVLQPLRDLEDQYAVVYWDQRNCGVAQGSADEGLTIDQFVDDTSGIIGLVKAKYDNPKIVLLGWSWGGTLGTAYLLDSLRQSEVSGWIEVDGGHNMKLGNALSRVFVQDYANSIVDSPASSDTDRTKWQQVLEWYESHPRIDRDSLLQHARYVSAAYGYLPEGAPPIDFGPNLFGEPITPGSPYDILAETMNDSTVVRAMDLTEVDYSSSMISIAIPVLILWGAKDGILPLPLAQDAYDHIGSVDKTLVELPNSGHLVVPEDLDLMETSVTGFVASLE